MSFLSPLRMNAGDVLESIQPSLTVRGDTFVVRVRGVSFAVDGRKENSRVDAELVVQRLPEFFDEVQQPMAGAEEIGGLNRWFGRRMRVMSWRWIPADE